MKMQGSDKRVRGMAGALAVVVAGTMVFGLAAMPAMADPGAGEIDCVEGVFTPEMLEVIQYMGPLEVVEIPEAEVPEQPSQPEPPEIPEQPEVPEVPEQPEPPETPEPPEVPEQPEAPEEPECPGDDDDEDEGEKPEAPETKTGEGTQAQGSESETKTPVASSTARTYLPFTGGSNDLFTILGLAIPRLHRS